ncbi:MAG: hypothetical protein J2P45_16275 [Candidatus Dormibacteraeota bacterium]|nr:hypothetical protein [Candidatus Dormibacteraeota bacterium]
MQHDTAVLAGSDWAGRARATYAPRSTNVFVGPAAPVLAPLEAYVAGGRLFYVDGAGTVWSLASAGQSVAVARFPTGASQQEVSFAVSPDGRQVWGTRLTVPAEGPPPSGSPFNSLNGPWKLELLRGSTGGPPALLQQWQSNDFPNAANGFQNLVLVGWDARGPVALIGNAIGVQNMWLDAQRVFSGHLSHLDSSGRPIDTITSSDCVPAAITAAAVTCVTAGAAAPLKFEAVDTTGRTIWDWTPTVQGPNGITGDFALSPDQRFMAMAGAIVGRDGSANALPANFHPEGWLDDTTLFGWLSVANGGGREGDAALVTLDKPGQATDLGFAADLVGKTG